MTTTVQRKVAIVVGMDTKAVSRGTAVVMSKMDRLKSAAMKIGKIFAAAMAIASVAAGWFLVKATKVAARTQVLNRVLGVVGKTAGYTAEELLGIRDRLIALGIAEQQAIGLQLRFMQSNLDLADSLKIARAAQDLAVVAGRDSSETALTLTNAIVMQRPILLKQFGIVLGLLQIYGDYAKSIGKTKEELTEFEKKQAFLNVILNKAKTVSGVYVESMKDVGKQVMSMPRYLQEAYNAMGKHFLPVMTEVVMGLKSFLGTIKRIGELKAVGRIFEILGRSLKPLRDFFKLDMVNVELFLITMIGGIAQIIVGFVEVGKIGVSVFKGIFETASLAMEGIIETGKDAWKVMKAIVTGKDVERAVAQFSLTTSAYLQGVTGTAAQATLDSEKVVINALANMGAASQAYNDALRESWLKTLGLIEKKPLADIPAPREREEPPIDMVKRLKQLAKLDEIMFEQRLIFADEFQQARMELDREYTELQKEIDELTLLSEGERHQASLLLLEGYYEKKRKIDEKQAKENAKLTKAQIKAQQVAAAFMFKLEANYVGRRIGLEKAAAAAAIEILGDEVKTRLLIKAKEWAAMAIAAAARYDFYAAAKYTAAVGLAGVGIAMVGEAVRSASERITGAGEAFEEMVGDYGEGEFQGTKGIRTQGAIATRGIQNLFISPTLSFNAETLIIGDTGLEVASETIKDIAVQGIKEAIETGEISIGV